MKICILQLLILSMFLATFSCCPSKTTMQTDIREHASREVAKTDIKRDSVFVYFSDTIRIIQKGDTVYNDVVRWRTQYKLIETHDTVLVSDTVRIVDTKYVTVTNTEKYPFYKKGWFVLLSLAVLYYGWTVITAKLKKKGKWTGLV